MYIDYANLTVRTQDGSGNNLSSSGGALNTAPLTLSGSGTIAANGAVLANSGIGIYSTAAIAVTGTFAMSFSFQASNDGTNYFTVNAYSAGSQQVASAFAVPGFYLVPVNYAFFKMVSTGYVSGTLAAVVLFTNTSPDLSVTNTTAASSALQSTGNASLTSIATNTLNTANALAGLGTVSTVALQNTQLTSLNSILALTGTQVGSWSMSPLDGTKATYSASIVGLVAATTAPTDIFTISGSASKIVRVLRLAVTATQTTSAQRDVVVLKRTTANTAGTSTQPARIAHDSTSAAATATVQAYTANPTVGTLAGIVRARKIFIATTANNSDEFIIEFGTRPSQAMVLRGVNEVLAINLNGVVSNGSSFSINVEFTEE